MSSQCVEPVQQHSSGSIVEEDPIVIAGKVDVTTETNPVQLKSTSDAATSTLAVIIAKQETDNKSQQTDPKTSADAATDQDVELFDSVLLQKLDYSQSEFKPSLLSEGLQMRSLKCHDYHKNYLGLLAGLTSVGEITFEQFRKQFEHMRIADQSYYVVVVEDVRHQKIVGTATLLLERKFIHGCSLRGRMEDVVVDGEYRKNRIGSLLVETIRLLAESLKVYKISLDCTDKLIDYYKKLGYKLQPGNANTMVIRYI